jgi:pimeloyl-ACP methyl ester carboxylesterase
VPIKELMASASYLEGRTSADLGDYAEVNAVRLWYQDTGGTGEPLVLVGGFTSGHYIFDFARPYLGNRRLITWEPAGLGLSDRPSPSTRPYSAEVWAEDLRVLLAHLNVERTAVWSVGFGSYISFRLAAEYPDLISRLVTYTDVWAGDEVKQYPRRWPPLKAIVDRHGTRGIGARLLNGTFVVSGVPWFTDWGAANVEETVHADTVRSTVGYGLLEADIRDDLHRVQAPVLVLMGGDTLDGGPADLEADPSLAVIRERVADVEVDVIDGSHPSYVVVQHPERCAASVVRFIAANLNSS